jgi:hypothetical protein
MATFASMAIKQRHSGGAPHAHPESSGVQQRSVQLKVTGCRRIGSGMTDLA